MAVYIAPVILAILSSFPWTWLMLVIWCRDGATFMPGSLGPAKGPWGLLRRWSE